MSGNTSIEWTNSTWSPIRARRIDLQSDGSGKERIGWHCEHVSPGCVNCYAERINLRLGTGREFKPAHLNHVTPLGDQRGDVGVFLDEKMLLQPLRWKRPRMIFVCSMTDLFADFVSDDWIDWVFAVIALCPQHTFQILTKRPERMHSYMTADGGFGRWGYIDGRARRLAKIPPGKILVGPLRNTWLGVSVEDQERADERIPLLLRTPACVRFLSCEPLIGRIDLCETFGMWWNSTMQCFEGVGRAFNQGAGRGGIDWVIAGSESGPGARPCDIEWVRALRDQCTAGEVAFFWKQHAFQGRKIPTPELDGRRWVELPKVSP